MDDGVGVVNLACFLGGKQEVVVVGMVVGMVGGDGKVGWVEIWMVVVTRPTLLRAPTVVLRRGNMRGEYVESGVVCEEDSVGARVTKGGALAEI